MDVLKNLCFNKRMSHDAPTFSPLYRQIKALILQALEAGEWRPGQAIPSEQELASRFNVSQGTVRKAIDEMAADNLLVRKQGKGTYVASHNDPRAMFRFLRLVPMDGNLSHPQSVPLDCWRAKAGQEASRMLGIEPGAPIIIIRRLLRVRRQARRHRRDLPAWRPVPGLEPRSPAGLERLAVQLVRDALRHAHDPCAGAHPRCPADRFAAGC